MLVCAIERVNRWRCRPCLLNHEPVEMETQISVSFSKMSAEGARVGLNGPTYG